MVHDPFAAQAGRHRRKLTLLLESQALRTDLAWHAQLLAEAPLSPFWATLGLWALKARWGAGAALRSGPPGEGGFWRRLAATALGPSLWQSAEAWRLAWRIFRASGAWLRKQRAGQAQA